MKIPNLVVERIPVVSVVQQSKDIPEIRIWGLAHRLCEMIKRVMSMAMGVQRESCIRFADKR